MKEETTAPERIAQAAEKIYRERYQADYEKRFPGQFVAIEIKTSEPYLGQYPELALQTAKKAAPNGIFHLIRIGSPGAYSVSLATHATGNRLF